MKDERWSENILKIEAFADYVNKKSFDGKLTYVIKPCKKQKVVLNLDAVEVINGTVKYIINLHYDRAVQDRLYMANTIFSYMVLFSLLLDGIDLPDGCYYHGKKTFGARAEKLGCNIGIDKRYGSIILSPPNYCLEYLETMPLDSYHYYSSTPTLFYEKNIQIKPKGSHSIKWVCPICGNITRSTKVINIKCGDCNVPFVISDKKR